MKKKLLLADDSVTIQRVVELTFADEGIEVVSVNDGDAAVARIEGDPPDIALVDASMPGRDGYAVASFIKGRADLASIPVVLLTGAFDPVDDERVAESKCDRVLSKPFEPQAVVRLVRELLPEGSLEPFSQPSAGDAEDDTSPGDASSHGPSADPPPAMQAVESEPVRLAEVPPASEPVETPASPLAEAFSALLAVETGETPAPSGLAPSGSPSAPVVSDALVEAVSRRVLERLTDERAHEIMSRQVLDVAERLVREEIARIRTEAG